MSNAPKLVGDQADVEQMNHMQQVIEKAILPYRENTEAVIVVGALMRVARILLRLYGPELRRGFIDASVAYLRGSHRLPDEQDSVLRKLGFWVPPGSSN